jgi:hypothetical protein
MMHLFDKFSDVGRMARAGPGYSEGEAVLARQGRLIYEAVVRTVRGEGPTVRYNIHYKVSNSFIPICLVGKLYLLVWNIVFVGLENFICGFEKLYLLVCKIV